MQYYQGIKKASTIATAGMKEDLFESPKLLFTVVFLGLVNTVQYYLKEFYILSLAQ